MSTGTVFKGSLLVAGTSIGGGMLAAPVLMGSAGFFPSLLVYFVCWAFMASTGLLLLEACLWLKRETNLISLAGLTLGTWGRVAAWAMYLFLFYCLTLAYLVGGGELVAEGFGDNISTWSGALLFAVVFTPMVFVGPRLVGRINLPLMAGLGLTYIAFVILGYHYVKPELLLEHRWSHMLAALPIAFTAFGFQGIVPTLATYLGHDAARTRRAILYGTLIPFAVYAIWQGLILGIVPIDGAGGLEEARQHGYTAVRPLKEAIQSPYIYLIGEFFAFFALTTSFLGVSLGLLDFLADGLKVEKTPRGRLLLCLIIMVPPLVLTQFYPEIFLDALSVAGGIGVAFLLGLLPILMVWRGRYQLKLPGKPLLPGGRWALTALLVFVGLELLAEVVGTLRAFF